MAKVCTLTSTMVLSLLDGLQYLYSDFEPNFAHVMFPCFDQPDMKGTLDLVVTVPSRWIAISNEKVSKSEKIKVNDNEESTYFNWLLDNTRFIRLPCSVAICSPWLRALTFQSPTTTRITWFPSPSTAKTRWSKVCKCRLKSFLKSMTKLYSFTKASFRLFTLSRKTIEYSFPSKIIEYRLFVKGHGKCRRNHNKCWFALGNWAVWEISSHQNVCSWSNFYFSFVTCGLAIWWPWSGGTICGSTSLLRSVFATFVFKTS